MPSRALGRYLLCDPIASGGMATVHLGRLLGPVGFSRVVAIKRLHPSYACDPEFVAMFLDEARVTARIRHPNVASTLDVVVLHGELFVVMDYVHGEALSKMLRSGAVPVPIAASIMAGVLYGLHAAHEASTDDGTPLRIVHRDVSPQNILVGSDGTARVVDFGVAKAVGRLQTTREGALKGKIRYMSPEQISSEDVDRRSDIYAASVVLWEMLTGRRLHQADSEVRVMQRILAGALEAPSRFVTLSPELDALVMKGLALDPADRFATASEMAEQIQRLAFATPGQVSEWVQSVGGKTLATRAKMIAASEREESPRLADSAIVSIRSAPEAKESAINGWLLASVILVCLALSTAAIAVVLHVTKVPAHSAEVSPPPTVLTAIGAEPSGEIAPLTLPSTESTTAKSPPPQAASTTRAHPPTIHCDPPYEIKDGIRFPKMECL
ncbi:MAG TPA: serine/threonine-protein kinase [Polyangiaceae bacterium]|nr:serine/threonine-protein kinase [Polyangiaceae bacterium]